MANELRKRQIAIGGLVEDNPLTLGATTLTSAGLAAVTGGVTSTEYMPIVLDPDRIDGAPEVVYVTALTGGAGSGTIVRACEGTTARQHVVNTKWVHAATPVDVPLTVDISWGGDLGYDYDFGANSTSLPSGWAYVNAGSLSYREKYGSGVVVNPGETGIHWRGISRSLSGFPSTWLATSKIHFMTRVGNETGAGFALRDSTNSKLVIFYVYMNNNTTKDIYVYKWTNETTASGGFAGPTIVSEHRPHYFRIRKNSGTSYDFEISENGTAWVAISSGNDVSAFMTPDQIGFMAYNSDGATIPWEMSVDWFRVR